MVGDKVKIEVGDFITLHKGTTQVTGQCMGFKVDKEGMVTELWIDGFYVSFELGENEHEWRIEDAQIQPE